MVVAWCERLAVEMAALGVTRVQEDVVAGDDEVEGGDETRGLPLLLRKAHQTPGLCHTAPVLFSGGTVRWVHQTIGEFFAARQCWTALDRLSFFHHKKLTRAVAGMAKDVAREPRRWGGKDFPFILEAVKYGIAVRE